jgi:hypothetical protein
MLRFLEQLLFQGNLCYYGVDERIRLQEQHLWGIFSGQEVPKTFFGLRWPTWPHNFGLCLVRLMGSRMALSNFTFGVLLILLIIVGSPGHAAEGRTAKEVFLQFGTLIGKASPLSEKTPAPDQTLAISRARQVPQAPPRQRSKKVSEQSLVITALDAQGQEVERYVIPDPRLLRAEEFFPSGAITSSRNYYRNEAQFSVVIPDDPGIKRLQIFQPHWTGQNFDLECIGEVAVP